MDTQTPTAEQPLPQSSSRLLWIDVLKGFGIYLVVVGHSLVGAGEATRPIFNYIYSLHMPLLFVLAGCAAFISMQRAKSYSVYIRKHAISLLLPAAAWVFLGQFIMQPYKAGYDFMGNARSLVIGSTAIWFLPSLLYLHVLYCLFDYLHTRFSFRPLVQCLCALAILALSHFLHRCFGLSSEKAGPWALQWLTCGYSYLPSFAFGVFIMRNQTVFARIFNSAVSLTICVAVLLFVNANRHSLPYSTYLRQVTGISASIVLIKYCLSYPLSQIVSSQASLFGRYSLVIYLAHGMCVNSAPCQLAGMNNLLACIIYGCTSLIVCYVCVALAKVLELSPFLSFVFMGKWRRDRVLENRQRTHPAKYAALTTL
ncbi:MAG: acyltransferase [Kiritimatiellae bacterium]|nr:acyltransferase [Kiritimatiellia bacterium]